MPASLFGSDKQVRALYITAGCIYNREGCTIGRSLLNIHKPEKSADFRIPALQPFQILTGRKFTAF